MIFLPVPVCLVGTFSIIVKSSGRFVSSSAPQTPVWLGNTLSPLPGTDISVCACNATRRAHGAKYRGCWVPRSPALI